MVDNSPRTDRQPEAIADLLAAMLHDEPEQYLVTVADQWGSIYVLEQDDFRILKFDEFYEQSKMRVSAPHVPVFDYIKAMLLSLALVPDDDILVLGLGGGSLIRALHHLRVDTAITVVEIRPTVVEIAWQYFAMPASANIKLVCDDASQFLAQPTRQYDLILADLFWAMRMDPLQAHNQFFQQCKQNLHPHGWLAVNYEQRSDLDDSLLSIMYRHFADVLVCTIPSGNAVVLAGSLATSGGMEEFLPRLAAIEARLNCKMDILMAKLQRARNPNDIELI